MSTKKFFFTDKEQFFQKQDVLPHFDEFFSLEKINRKFLILNNDNQVSTLIKVEGKFLDELSDIIPFFVKNTDLVADHSFNLSFYKKNYYGSESYLLSLSLSKTEGNIIDKKFKNDSEGFEDVQKLVGVLAKIVEQLMPRLQAVKCSPKWLSGEEEILTAMLTFWMGEDSLLKEKGAEDLRSYLSLYLLGSEKHDVIYRCKHFQSFYTILNRSIKSVPDTVKKLIKLSDEKENFIIINSFTKEKSGMIYEEEEKNLVKKLQKTGIKKDTEFSFSSTVVFYYPNERVPEFGSFKEGKAFNQLEHDAINMLMEATNLSWEMVSTIWPRLLYQTMPGNYFSTFRDKENLTSIFSEIINEDDN